MRTLILPQSQEGGQPHELELGIGTNTVLLKRWDASDGPREERYDWDEESGGFLLVHSRAMGTAEWTRHLEEARRRAGLQG